MADLEIKIADLSGSELAYVADFADLTVEVPINDSRSGSFRMSMYDEAAKYITPMNRVVKIYYGDQPICFGRILRPRFDFEAGVVEVSFHDPTVVLKHTFHRFGDYVVDFGYPADGRGAFWLLESSIPLDNQIDRGVKPNGILYGQNLTTNQGPRPTQNPPEQGSGIWGRCIRGENVWDSLQKLANKAIGPDFEFVPEDGLDPGYFCKMNVGAKPDDPGGGTPLGTDRSASVGFLHGINCNLVWEPDGNAIRNYYVAVNPGGETDRSDTAKNKAVAHSEASWLKYGILQGWESVGEKLPQALLKADANAWVSAYSEPPDFFSVAPFQDAENVPLYGRDFKVGDFIKASGRRGKISVQITGRVMRATVNQVREGSRQGRVDVECAPLVGVTLGDGEGPII